MTTFIWVVLALTLLESIGYLAHISRGQPRTITRAQLAVNVGLNICLMLWGAWLLGGA